MEALKTPMTTIIKPVGIQRVGTTYTCQSIKDNFEDVITLTHHLGWKHELKLPTVEKSKKHWNRNLKKYKNQKLITEVEKALVSHNVKLIIVIKDPYMWYESIYRFGKRNGWKERTLEKDDTLLYTNFNKFYADKLDFLQNRRTCVFDQGMIVRYEDLLRDFKGTLHSISKHFSIKLKNNITNPTKVSNSNKFNRNKREYYLRSKPNLSNKKIKYITELVDWDLMEKFGYYPKE